jgi:hypothetical protein
MFSAKQGLRAIAFCSVLLCSGIAAANSCEEKPQEPYGDQVRDIQGYLNLLNGVPHIRAWYDGTNVLTYKSCYVILESDPDAIRFRIASDSSSITETEVGIYASGRNEIGDSFLVTKIFKYPSSYLVNVYHQVRVDPRHNGNLTLVINKDASSKLSGISISDGEGITNCSDLTPR